MPKYAIEIDTDTKTSKFTIDGTETQVTSVNLGCYTDCCWYPNAQKSLSISWEKDGLSQSLSFRGDYMVQSKGKSVASYMRDTVENVFAVDKMTKILTKNLKK